MFFGKINHLYDPALIKMLVRGLYGNREFHIPFWSMIYVALKFALPVLRCRILIPKDGKLWTRMECGIFVPKHALNQHFPNFWVCKMRDTTKQNFLI